MDDLISRSALLEQMHNHYEVRNPKQNATMDECCMMVIHAPAVDAVEVIRCKDCKHAGKHEAIFFPGHIPCGLRMQPTIVKPDDFCSYGERRAIHDE